MFTLANWRVWRILLWLPLLAACSQQPVLPAMRGANLLPTDQVALSDAATSESLQQLQSFGANTIALIPFLHQASPTAVEVSPLDVTTQQELVAAIHQARQLGFQVILKPQLLVDHSWAGEIEPDHGQGWAAWFASYQAALRPLAQMAREEQVSILVIGTELRHAADSPYWPPLIAELRSLYPGHLSYAAHGLDELERFNHWALLDSAAVTLYPPLGTEPTRRSMRKHIDAEVKRLENIARRIDKPLWIAEIGIPSYQGAQQTPWDWHVLRQSPGPTPDMRLQATVIDLWLDALARRWIEGVLIWNWFSDPAAGGPADIGYSLQNKTAAAVLACHWQQHCDSRIRDLR